MGEDDYPALPEHGGCERRVSTHEHGLRGGL